MSLSLDALQRFAADLAADATNWASLAAQEGDERAYELIWDDAEVNAWAIRWTEDSDTGFHDHDASAAGITVIAGAVREDRLALGGAPRSREFGAGETFGVELTGEPALA